MGFFDAFDSFIDAVENGAIEKRVTQILDKVEGTAGKTLEKGEQLAGNVDKLATRLTEVTDKTEKTLDNVDKKVQ